jgi:MSHA pilin protein MshC
MRVNTRPEAMPYAMRHCLGFTMVELIVTITIVGILSAVAAPRFLSRDGFDSIGFTDQVESLTRYAQKVAIAKRRNVCVTLTASTVSLNYSNPGLCDTALFLPSTQTNTLNAPNGLTLSAANFYFDSLGRPFYVAGNASFGNNALSITVNATPPRTITVVNETGYVHQ